MLKTRKWNYKLFSRCFAHFNVGLMCLLLHSAFTEASLQTKIWTAAVALAYVQHISVARNLVELTAPRLKILNSSMHFLVLFVIIGTSATPSTFEFACMQVLQTSFRFLLILCLLDPWVSIPFGVLYTTVEIVVYCFYFEVSSTQWVLLCGAQFLILIISIRS